VNETLLGTLLGGRYRLDARIGHGGMSTVYRAFDTVLEREVAIKLMHRDRAADDDQLERFRREARAVAQLSHPHIVTVIDAGEEPSVDADTSDGEGADEGGLRGTPYIVFEHVSGETLKALIRRDGPLDVTQALAYAVELARALGAAHERHIVHRDVKPQNVLLTADGTAKITDFGIARTLTEEGLTLDGRVLGTTDYVSPEQALGQSVTGQSDIYSLGILLYEMLVGRVPFTAETPVAVAMRHVRESVPDVQRLRPDVSAATAAVVDRATAHDLSHRYRDIPALLADLEEALAIEASRSGQATGEVTSVLRTLPRSARRRLPWRMRHPIRWLSLFALVLVLVPLVLILAAGQTRRGTGLAPGAVAHAGLIPVSLAQSAAHDYNPFGTGPENPDLDANAIDSDPNTAWSTEHYYDGTLKKAGGTGVGLYLDAAPGVAARQIELQTPTPGFAVQIYVANHIRLSLPYGSSIPLTARGWQGPVGEDSSIHNHDHIPLDLPPGQFRYYLVWLTTLPPGQETASISEISLFR
jgi:eukaryotic-like serine/threonine-protein kinase